jgi:hypothetical protein
MGFSQDVRPRYQRLPPHVMPSQFPIQKRVVSIDAKENKIKGWGDIQLRYEWRQRIITFLSIRGGRLGSMAVEFEDMVMSDGIARA